MSQNFDTYRPIVAVPCSSYCVYGNLLNFNLVDIQQPLPELPQVAYGLLVADVVVVLLREIYSGRDSM